MSTGWIDAVMRMNQAIVAAQTRFDAQVIVLVETADRGQDTTEAEGLLVSHRRSLNLLRTIQAQLLREMESEA